MLGTARRSYDELTRRLFARLSGVTGRIRPRHPPAFRRLGERAPARRRTAEREGRGGRFCPFAGRRRMTCRAADPRSEAADADG